MVSVDCFRVSTIRFQILYVFLALAHERRRLLHFAVTAHRAAEWTHPTVASLMRSRLSRPSCLPSIVGTEQRVWQASW